MEGLGVGFQGRSGPLRIREWMGAL
jgi:hypothetical protein